MNVTQAREISIEKVLQNLGCEATKTNEKESWYLSPLRVEKSASFKINRIINRWYDHGEQKGGNVIDFVIAKFGFTVSEALEYLTKFETFFSFQKQIFETSKNEKESTTNIEKVIPIQHVALIQYLNQRGISKFRNSKELNEIHYWINGKSYFALGFVNNSFGFEARSKYAKLCLKKKDITIISNGKKLLTVFEGYFDYLSFIQKVNRLDNYDYLILNSVALLHKNLSVLMNYNLVELYLDNDTAGDKYTKLIITQFKTAFDYRFLFKGYKDLNECLIDGGLNEEFVKKLEEARGIHASA
jgi:DNA primase